jgi:hypothetical protein
MIPLDDWRACTPLAYIGRCRCFPQKVLGRPGPAVFRCDGGCRSETRSIQPGEQALRKRSSTPWRTWTNASFDESRPLLASSLALVLDARACDPNCRGSKSADSDLCKPTIHERGRLRDLHGESRAQSLFEGTPEKHRGTSVSPFFCRHWFGCTRLALRHVLKCGPRTGLSRH